MGHKTVLLSGSICTGRFIYIDYYAMRDKDGNYLGTIEFTQDLTRLRALQGEQRLLSYTGN